MGGERKEHIEKAIKLLLEVELLVATVRFDLKPANDGESIDNVRYDTLQDVGQRVSTCYAKLHLLIN